jgi:hypothetical protein
VPFIARDSGLPFDAPAPERIFRELAAVAAELRKQFA